MRKTAKAYLKTEGKLDYRNCEISYYTYNMEDTPNKYMVNVNVTMQYANTPCIKSLATNEDFDQDIDAINYGIGQGKKYIDRSYELGKISSIATLPPSKKFGALSAKMENTGKAKSERK